MIQLLKNTFVPLGTGIPNLIKAWGYLSGHSTNDWRFFFTSNKPPKSCKEMLPDRTIPNPERNDAGRCLAMQLRNKFNISDSFLKKKIIFCSLVSRHIDS